MFKVTLLSCEFEAISRTEFPMIHQVFFLVTLTAKCFAAMEELNGRQNVVVGIIAGCIQCVLDHPLVTLKNAYQQSLEISLHPRILYRGTVADMISLSSLTAIQFYGTGAIKHLILHNKALLATTDTELKLTSNEILLSSLGGGMLSGLVCSPWELIMIQQQRYGGSLLSVYSRIANTNVRLFARGVLPSMGREGVFTMGYLGITPILESYSSDEENSGFGYKFGCAMLSGFFAVVVSHPFDTIKTCQQGDLQGEHFKGIVHSFRFLYTKYGLKRIYTGSSFRFGICGLAFFVFNRVTELIAPKIYPRQFEDLY